YGYIHYQQDEAVQHKLNELAQELDADEMPAQVIVSLDASSRIRGGSTHTIWLDSRRMHVFNPETGENLTRDAEAGAELTREANEERKAEIERSRRHEGSAGSAERSDGAVTGNHMDGSTAAR
ncbi:hypothetical protein K1Y78_58385, partial [Streptomyces sp. tea 10]|nr:hypothetical protein [Streptomyces sp. tea 10]